MNDLAVGPANDPAILDTAGHLHGATYAGRLHFEKKHKSYHWFSVALLKKAELLVFRAKCE